MWLACGKHVCAFDHLDTFAPLRFPERAFVGIEAVPPGQIEAARALGLHNRQIARHVVFPQAFRVILPPLGNDFVSMVKDSALVSSLGVQDITQLGKVYSSGSFKFFETYNVVAFLYLTMTISLSLIVRYIERRLRKY